MCEKYQRYRYYSIVRSPVATVVYLWKLFIGYNVGIDDGPESKFGASKELIVLNILKYKYCVNKSHDMSCHLTILLKIVNY